MRVSIVPYNPLWPSQYDAIASDLHDDLTLEAVHFLSIQHVGSTSIPGLCAKPILDIMIVIPPPVPVTIDGVSYFDKIHYALIFGERQGGYKLIGNGGVEGRWSFKLYREDVPARNIYVVTKESLVYRSWLDLRDVLKKVEHQALREEYGRTKMELAKEEWADVMEYATAKNPVIRKILKAAGWTDAQVDAKEKAAVKSWFGAGTY